MKEHVTRCNSMTHWSVLIVVGQQWSCKKKKIRRILRLWTLERKCRFECGARTEGAGLQQTEGRLFSRREAFSLQQQLSHFSLPVIQDKRRKYWHEPPSACPGGTLSPPFAFPPNSPCFSTAFDPYTPPPNAHTDTVLWCHWWPCLRQAWVQKKKSLSSFIGCQGTCALLWSFLLGFTTL